MMTLPSEEISYRESKIKLRIAQITLAGVILTVGITMLQSWIQYQSLSQIAQNFKNLNELKKVLMMPLEGVWHVAEDYKQYFGKTDHHYSLIGKAVFVGKDEAVGYQVYFGGSVHQELNKEELVTFLVDFSLDADAQGLPTPESIGKGQYIARTSSVEEFKILADNRITLTDWKVHRYASANRIKELECKFSVNEIPHRTEAIITFSRE